jgi:mRNA interferase RelE/StbE
MSYQVMVSPPARKQLEELDPKMRRRMTSAFVGLEADPFHARPGVDIRKLAGVGGKADLFRLRVGQYRVIYEVLAGKVWVSEVLGRSTAYRFL